MGFPKGFGFRKTFVKRSGGEAAACFICNAKRCRIVKRNGINENNRFIYGNGLLLGWGAAGIFQIGVGVKGYK